MTLCNEILNKTEICKDRRAIENNLMVLRVLALSPSLVVYDIGKQILNKEHLRIPTDLAVLSTIQRRVHDLIMKGYLDGTDFRKTRRGTAEPLYRLSLRGLYSILLLDRSFRETHWKRCLENYRDELFHLMRNDRLYEPLMEYGTYGVFYFLILWTVHDLLVSSPNMNLDSEFESLLMEADKWYLEMLLGLERKLAEWKNRTLGIEPSVEPILVGPPHLMNTQENLRTWNEVDRRVAMKMWEDGVLQEALRKLIETKRQEAKDKIAYYDKALSRLEESSTARRP